MKKLRSYIAFFILAYSASFSCLSDILIVTAPASQIELLTESQCRMLWLGERGYIKGKKFSVVDQFISSDVRKNFYLVIASLSQKELRNYRAKQIFSSGVFPPESKADDSEVIEWIGKGKNRIGYINSSSLTDELKVLYVLEEERVLEIYE